MKSNTIAIWLIGIGFLIMLVSVVELVSVNHDKIEACQLDAIQKGFIIGESQHLCKHVETITLQTYIKDLR